MAELVPVRESRATLGNQRMRIVRRSSGPVCDVAAGADGAGRQSPTR
jgi:hypothetical protein